MKITYILIVFIVASITSVSAKTCVHNNLSKLYNYQLSVSKYHDDSVSARLENAKVSLSIYSKRTQKLIQTIKLTSEFLFEDAFTKCNSVRSYITGVNKDAEVSDNDYGDMLIADLNFDGNEDIAIKQSSGGNTGPVYSFYIQQIDGSFKKDLFLTDKVSFFPAEIDVANKRLITRTIAGVRYLGETTFKYSPKTKGWKKIGHKLFDVSEQ